MVTATHSMAFGKATVWSGRIISGFAGAFLLMDCVLKLLELAPAVEATTRLGYPVEVIVGIGVVQLICLALYALPHTSALGALLMTGYLGGAVATHVRAGSDIFSLVFPFMIGAMIWGGLLLRDERLRGFVLSQR